MFLAKLQTYALDNQVNSSVHAVGGRKPIQIWMLFKIPVFGPYMNNQPLARLLIQRPSGTRCSASAQ